MYFRIARYKYYPYQRNSYVIGRQSIIIDFITRYTPNARFTVPAREMGSILRSEEMMLLQLLLQSDSAYACVRELGEVVSDTHTHTHTHTLMVLTIATSSPLTCALSLREKWNSRM